MNRSFFDVPDTLVHDYYLLARSAIALSRRTHSR